MLDARPEDVTYERREVRLTADANRKKTFAEIAFAATDFSHGRGQAALRPGLSPGSRRRAASSRAMRPSLWDAHLRRGGGWGDRCNELQRYLAVDNCGNVINPLIVDGQVHGGIAQGLAQTLYEEVVYDENGQLISGSLMDYAMPKATMVPTLETDRTSRLPRQILSGQRLW